MAQNIYRTGKESFSYFLLLKESSVYSMVEKIAGSYNKAWEDDYIVMYEY